MREKKKTATASGNFTPLSQIGRKPLKVGLKKVPVCISVDPKIYAKAKKLSRLQKTTFSSFVTTILAKTIGKYK